MRYFSTCAEKKTFFIFKYFSFFFEILHKNFDTSLWKNLGIDCLAMFYSNWPRFRKIWRCISFLSTGNTSLQFFLCLKVWKNREKFKKKSRKFAIYLIWSIKLGRAKNFPGRALPVLAPTWLRAWFKFTN